MLYTGKGDNGKSELIGTKECFPKNGPIYEALGTLDELNSLLGVCRAYSAFWKGNIKVAKEIKSAQECLFIIQAEVAGAQKSILQNHVEGLENIIKKIEKLIKSPHTFIIPGSTKLSALLDYARAISRRAERKVLAAHKFHKISPQTRIYLNRLSSFLYALARYVAKKEGAKESSPSYL